MLHQKVIIISVIFVLITPSNQQLFDIEAWLNKLNKQKNEAPKEEIVLDPRNIVVVPCQAGYQLDSRGWCREMRKGNSRGKVF